MELYYTIELYSKECGAWGLFDTVQAKVTTDTVGRGWFARTRSRVTRMDILDARKKARRIAQALFYEHRRGDGVRIVAHLESETIEDWPEIVWSNDRWVKDLDADSRDIVA